MVDGPQPTVRADEDVTTLAVGVVGHHVEETDGLQDVFVTTGVEQREVVLLVVGLDEQLHATGSERAVVTEQGRWHQSPPE